MPKKKAAKKPTAEQAFTEMINSNIHYLGRSMSILEKLTKRIIQLEAKIDRLTKAKMPVKKA